MDKFFNRFCFIFDRKYTISYSLFSNVLNRKNIYCLYGALSFKQNLFSKVYNRFLYKWARAASIFKKRIYKNKIVIFTNESLRDIPNSVLSKIKKKAKATVLFLIDETFNRYPSVEKAKNIIANDRSFFDLVYTFSPKDAVQQDFRLNTSYYSQLSEGKKQTVSDVFFVGSLKGRGDLLTEAEAYFATCGVESRFFISAPKAARTNKKFCYRTISYPHAVNCLSEANCIFDIADERQTGMTLRYYEAVVYNKKLLTNNKNIVDMPYYDERYMKVYSDVEDIKKIDAEWFKTSEGIEYGYKGEFEPLHFLQRISEDLT